MTGIPCGTERTRTGEDDVCERVGPRGDVGIVPSLRRARLHAQSPSRTQTRRQALWPTRFANAWSYAYEKAPPSSTPSAKEKSVTSAKPSPAVLDADQAGEYNGLVCYLADPAELVLPGSAGFLFLRPVRSHCNSAGIPLAMSNKPP